MKARQKILTAGVKSLTITNDIEKTQSERLEVFFEYCKVSEAPHIKSERTVLIVVVLGFKL